MGFSAKCLGGSNGTRYIISLATSNIFSNILLMNDKDLFNKAKNELAEFGKQLSMHVAALSPIAIDKDGVNKNILDKEREIITEELKNSGKDPKIAEKISLGKLNKFINDNTLLNQEWIIEPKKKVKDILKEVSGKDKIEIKKFVRFKVGEGV